MNNILISGGAGFIGSRLCVELFNRGYNITVLDNLSQQIHGLEESQLYKIIKNKCRFIKGDVRDKNDWITAIQGQDAIIHFAAETGTGQSMYKVHQYSDVNIIGTSSLLDVLTNTNHTIKKIIVASSRAIYGEGKYCCLDHGVQYPKMRFKKDLVNNEFNPKCNVCKKELNPLPTDEESKIHATSIYAITKQNQEQMIMLMGEVLNIPTVAFRYQNVYGPGQSLLNPYTGILSVFSTRILNNNPIEIYEDGLESRDFVYIDDVVNATILGLKEEANGHVFNVGSGEQITVKEVAESLKRLYNSKINILTTGKFRSGDIRHNFADISKINNVLGFTPKYDFQNGVLEFVSWVKTQKVMKDNYQVSIEELKNKGLIN